MMSGPPGSGKSMLASCLPGILPPLSPAEALRAATSNPAEFFGFGDQLGSVDAGKIADLVVVRGNPAASAGDVRNVTHVFKDGVGYDPAKLLAYRIPVTRVMQAIQSANNDVGAMVVELSEREHIS